MIKRIATTDDLDRLIAFYKEVILSQEEGKDSPEWKMDIYPTKDDLIAHLENGELYLIEDDEDIAAAGVLVCHEDPIYKNGNWSTSLNDDEIGVIHLLATHPYHRRKGYAIEMIGYLKDMARQNGLKAIHLDALAGNGRALKLYLKAGFHNVDFTMVYYDDLGYVDVNLFEYVIEQ